MGTIGSKCNKHRSRVGNAKVRVEGRRTKLSEASFSMDSLPHNTVPILYQCDSQECMFQNVHYLVFQLMKRLKVMLLTANSIIPFQTGMLIKQECLQNVYRKYKMFILLN